MSQATLVQSVQQTTIKMRPDLDDKTLRYVQDLLAWVEENQQRIDEASWGSDLPTVESQLGSHRGLHQTVEDFRSKIERARADEVPFIKPLRNITHCWIVVLTGFCFSLFFRLNFLPSVRTHTENTWGNWTFSMANYWYV